MNNTYVFLNSIIPLLNNESDKDKFTNYKNTLAALDYDTYVEVDCKDLFIDNVLDEQKFFTLYSNELVMKCPQFCQGSIMYDYYFYEWGFIKYSRKLGEENKNTNIYSYLKKNIE